MLPNENASIIKNETTTGAAKNDLEDNEYVPRRRSRQNSVVTNENNIPNKLLQGRRRALSTNRRLGEAVTQVSGLSYCSLLL